MRANCSLRGGATSTRVSSKALAGFLNSAHVAAHDSLSRRLILHGAVNCIKLEAGVAIAWKLSLTHIVYFFSQFFAAFHTADLMALDNNYLFFCHLSQRVQYILF
jgi:hypothetical protein